MRPYAKPADILMTYKAETEKVQQTPLTRIATCIRRYGKHFDWVRDTKFVRELENDSIDLETIEDELRTLRETEHNSTIRHRIVHFLRKSPVQIALCVLVLFDVAIGIAQLLIDIHAVREQLTIREDELDAILRLVCNDTCKTSTRETHIQIAIDLLRTHPALTGSQGLPHLSPPDRLAEYQKPLTPYSTYSYVLRSFQNSRLHHHATLSKSASPDVKADETIADTTFRSVSVPPILRHTAPNRLRHTPVHDFLKFQDDLVHADNLYNFSTINNTIYNFTSRDLNIAQMMRIAHLLHCAGISILGILLLEDMIKILAMGRDFFRHKIEIFDAVVITVSFVFDIVFLSDIYGAENEKAAAVIVILLMWRIARITDSILITVKQRQEFRIRLQKSARRKAEKKLEYMEEDRHLKMREIHLLRELCLRSNIAKEDVDACNPGSVRRASNTLNALGSVARLSLSMTMSLSSSAAALFTLADDKFCSTDNESLELSPAAARFFSRSMPVTPVRRLPKAVVPQSAECDVAVHEKLRKRESPVNVSGVQIVVDESSDTELQLGRDNAKPSSSTDLTTTDSGFYSYLAVDRSAASSRRTSESNASDVYLLTSYC